MWGIKLVNNLLLMDRVVKIEKLLIEAIDLEDEIHANNIRFTPINSYNISFLAFWYNELNPPNINNYLFLHISVFGFFNHPFSLTSFCILRSPIN